MKNLSPTELLYPSKLQIDQLDTSSAFDLMLKDHAMIYQVLKSNKNEILKTIKYISSQLKKYKNSKLIYCGSGTSARIGVQDGVELYPTFGWPREKVDFIIAGREEALLRSVENSEDDIKQAKVIFNEKSKKAGCCYLYICGGNTLFTNEILNLCIIKGIKTIAICNNPKGDLLKKADFKILLDTKQEVIAGSTRLKAGTSQKLCLNIISSLVMTNLGNVKNGMMINLIPSNKKLRERLSRINKKFGGPKLK